MDHIELKILIKIKMLLKYETIDTLKKLKQKN